MTINYIPLIGGHYDCEEADTAGLVDEVAAANFAINGSPVGSVAGALNQGRGPCSGFLSAGGSGFSRTMVGGGPFDTRRTTISRFTCMGWGRLQAGHGATQEFISQARVIAAANTRAFVLRGVQFFGPGSEEGPVFLGWDGSAFTLSTGFNWTTPIPHNEWYFLGFSMDFTVPGNGRFVGYIRVPSIGSASIVIDPVPVNMWTHTNVDAILVGIDSGHSTGGQGFEVDHITTFLEYAVADATEFALFSQAPIVYPGGFDMTGPVLDPPTNLAVAPAGVDTLNLTWDDNSSGEDSYRVERKDPQTGLFSEIAQIAADSISFPDTGLPPRTTQTYRVRSEAAGLFSDYSNEASGTTAEIPSPTNLAVSPVGTSRLDLTWDDNFSGEDSYRVERAESQTGPFVEIGQVPADVTFFSDTGFSPATTRFYRVRAEAGGFFSDYTNIASGTTDGVPPPPPTELVKSELTATSVVLSWNLNSSNETSVEVHRAQDDDAGPYSVLVALAAGVTTYTDNTIGSTFFYKVRVLNPFGASGFSNIVGLTTPPVPGEQPEPVPCDPPAQSTPFFNDLMPETSFRVMNQAIEDWLTGMRFRDMYPQTVDNALISRDYSQTHEVTPGFPVNQTSPFPKLTYHMTGLVPDRSRWQPNPVVNLGPRPQRWMPCNQDSAPAVGSDVFEISNRAYATADQKSVYLLPWPIPFNLTYQIDLWTKTGQDMLFLRSAILARFTHVDETYLKATFPGYGRQLLRLSLDRWDDTSSIETGEEERELRNTLTITLYGWLFRVPTLKKTIENAHIVTIDGSPPDDDNCEDGSEFLQWYNDPQRYTFSADGKTLLSVEENPVFTPPDRVMFWVSGDSDGITVGP